VSGPAARMVYLYLSAIVLANLSVGYFGPSAVVVNAFLFIGLDLTSRDKLHETWSKKGLVWKMALLIAVGSFLSWVFNQGVAKIAIASFVAFAVSAIVDTAVYSMLHAQPRWIRINGSNIPSALVDSLIFPTLTFGSFMPWIVAGQFAAKVLGGLLWMIILNKRAGNAK
jgi:uncharacterized PurR-regulated membrane protein YhhQ (DUF165 family)